jgi:hypothetical protein
MAIDEEPCLTLGLLGVAGDPERIKALHGILGDFCHVFRNRINGIKLSLFLARRQEQGPAGTAWDDLESRYRAVEQLIEHVQWICRPLPLRPVRLSLCDLIAERAPCWTRTLEGRGRRLVLQPPGEASVGEFDPSRLSQGLNEFVAWRARAEPGGTAVLLRWGVDGGELTMEWDDPDSLTPDLAARCPGAPPPLALPILARVMTAHGGRLTLEPGRGLRVRCQWPAEVSPS